MAARLFVSRWILPRPGEWIEGGGLLVVDGRIARVLRSRSQLRRSPGARVELGEAVLAPGFVDAHAHLELSGLEGRLRPGTELVEWIRAVLRWRAGRGPARTRLDALRGARMLLASGTTCVGDID